MFYLTPSEYALFNRVEAALWFTMGAVLFVAIRRTRPAYRRLARNGGVAFVVFGITDLVEAVTYPPWLLLIKAACVIVLFATYARFVRVRRRESSPRSAP